MIFPAVCIISARELGFGLFDHFIELSEGAQGSLLYLLEGYTYVLGERALRDFI